MTISIAFRAEVAELADALHSGCSTRQGVEVRVLSSAPPSWKAKASCKYGNALALAISLQPRRVRYLGLRRLRNPWRSNSLHKPGHTNLFWPLFPSGIPPRVPGYANPRCITQHQGTTSVVPDRFGRYQPSSAVGASLA